MANPIASIAKIPELRKRVLFTLGLLAVYRVGIFITTPGVNRAVMSKIMASAGGGFLAMFNMFSGGALEQMSIFALGIMPYISASIIVQLLTVVVPAFERLQKEGQQGQRRINQYTRYGTILISLVQGYFIATQLEGYNNSAEARNELLVLNPGLAFQLMTMLTLTTGTAFIMWLGEQITERGIGNGSSLIIFAGIISGLPAALGRLYQKSASEGDLSLFGLFTLGGIVVAVIAAIIFFERGQRRIPVQYAKRSIGGGKTVGGQSSHLPLKLNVSGVIPPIFASSILMFPQQIANARMFKGVGWLQSFASALNYGDWRFSVLYVSLIVFFCYFYTAVTFNPVDVADNMKKYGGFIPGVRPGKATAEYIDRVLSRLTFGGAIYISSICVLPMMIQKNYGQGISFGGTGLLIVVGVALDTVQQIESHLITRNYEGFAGPKGPRIRGRAARAAV